MKSKHKKNGPSGLWDASTDMELVATQKLASNLKNLEAAARHCYESGVQVGTLKGKRIGQIDMSLAALFLKRTLNDLRSVWLLSSKGYTSQAATVAATLFEHALSVNCLAGSPENAKKFLDYKSDDLPWTPKQLSKLLAKQYQKESLEQEEPFDKNEFELAWREIYYAYKLLCKIKHPTARSVIHDSMSTKRPNGTYVIMVYPDIRPEDLPLKVVILSIAINRCYTAIEKFANALECDDNDSYYKDFCSRLNNVNKYADEALKAIKKTPLPFDISDSKFYKEYEKLKSINS